MYEAMKMRSKPSVPFDKDAIKTVGGGFLEKQLAKSGDILDLTGPGQYMTERSSIDEIYGTESRGKNSFQNDDLLTSSFFTFHSKRCNAVEM